MKKYIALFLSAILCACSVEALPCHASHFDAHKIYLNYENAPEGTAYIDVLAQIESDSEFYSDFNAVPKREIEVKTVDHEAVYETLEIDENSQIATYCEDGFVSLSLHSTEVTEVILFPESTHNYHSYNYRFRGQFVISCYAEDLYIQYKPFKIAYVSENGEILQITEPTKGEVYTRSSPFEQGGEPWTFKSNGTEAYYITPYNSPTSSVLYIGGYFALFIFLPLLLIALVIIAIVKLIVNHSSIW